MEGTILRPKNAKKPSKIKKEIIELRKNLESVVIEKASTSSNPDEVAVDEAALTLLKKLKFFQDRAHTKNPIKAKAHRRLIYGLREIKRDANLVKAVIIARDIENYTEESELSKLIEQVAEKCSENNVPRIFALKKSKLARIFNKPRSVGAVGILDYSGAEILFNALITAGSKMSQQKEFDSNYPKSFDSFQQSLFA